MPREGEPSQLDAAHGDAAAGSRPVAVAHLRTLVADLPSGPVLDPFAGIGNVGVACLREGRASVCIERDARNTGEAQRRLDLDDRRARCAWKLGDCVHEMRQIRARSFSGVVTDIGAPNSSTANSAAFEPAVWAEVFRLLRPGGQVRVVCPGPALVRCLWALAHAGFEGIALSDEDAPGDRESSGRIVFASKPRGA
jgi:DNA modification methylase